MEGGSGGHSSAAVAVATKSETDFTSSPKMFQVHLPALSHPLPQPLYHLVFKGKARANIMRSWEKEAVVSCLSRFLFHRFGCVIRATHECSIPAGVQVPRDKSRATHDYTRARSPHVRRSCADTFCAQQRALHISSRLAALLFSWSSASSRDTCTSHDAQSASLVGRWSSPQLSFERNLESAVRETSKQIDCNSHRKTCSS